MLLMITGATSGIGQAASREAVARGHRVIACGRRLDRLEALQSELGADACHILSFDVAEAKAVAEAFESLSNEWRMIDGLVNNAGNAHGLAPIQADDPANWTAMIDSNVTGLLNVTRQALKLMIGQGRRGHIVNIGSVAGRQAYPGGAVYCATKSAVRMISDGMRQDLLPEGIRLTCIEPGMVNTEFSLVRFKGDRQRADSVYKGMTPLSGQDVAEVILYALEAPAHVCLAEILLLPTNQASATVVHRLPTQD